MTALDAVLAARAHTEGRAQRRTAFRHRRLRPKPIVMVPWHLGAEPFTFAAFAYNDEPDDFLLAVPGEPRNRDLLFGAALEVADWFLSRFEEPWSRRQANPAKNPWPPVIAPEAPQIIVPNQGAVTVLAKLARRLSYLPTEPREDGPPPADPRLVRFGRHLQFLTSNALKPGQQLLLNAAQLAGDGWMTAQTVSERANLAALDAWIDPPHGVHGFDAAARAEHISCGPLPLPEVESRVDGFLQKFNDARRAGDTQSAAENHAAMVDIYRQQSQLAWDLTWKVIDRERRQPEEPRFVERRWQADVAAYSAHMMWMDGPADGVRRTRQTVPQAIKIRQQAEETAKLVEAEEAVSDAIRMIPYLLDHKAIEGEVLEYDPNHREVKEGKQRASVVPVVVLRTESRSLMPVGKELWWTESPDRVKVVVVDVSDDANGSGSIIELKVMQNLKDAAALEEVDRACFSLHSTAVRFGGTISDAIPWTHRIPDEAGPNDLEESA